MDQKEDFPKGSLAVVAMPLGNPDDLTVRAVKVLKAADRIAAEDTRTVGRTLRALGVTAVLTSYHDWNEEQRAGWLVERLAAGERVAVVSEAGTPGISDPGFDLVRGARQRGLEVFPVPGPSAVVAFLSAAGLPTDRFSFFGFPPNRPTRRRALFATLVDRPETLVFYESPRRVVACLADALTLFGDRPCALAREMTKPHEEFLYGDVSAVADGLARLDRVRGEITWAVAGCPKSREPAVAEVVERVVAEAAGQPIPPRQAARAVAERCGITAKEAYARVVARRRNEAS